MSRGASGLAWMPRRYREGRREGEVPRKGRASAPGPSWTPAPRSRVRAEPRWRDRRPGIPGPRRFEQAPGRGRADEIHGTGMDMGIGLVVYRGRGGGTAGRARQRASCRENQGKVVVKNRSTVSRPRRDMRTRLEQ